MDDNEDNYPSHDGDGFQGEEARVADFVVNDGVEHFLLVVPGKRRLAHCTSIQLVKYIQCRKNVLFCVSDIWIENRVYRIQLK